MILKIDILNKLSTDKYYLETELVRIATDSSTEYRENINKFCSIIDEIVKVNNALKLIEDYFDENTEINSIETDK